MMSQILRNASKTIYGDERETRVNNFHILLLNWREQKSKKELRL